MSFADRFESLSLKNEVTADILECPVCLEICKDPSYECRNGHLICGRCLHMGDILSCPICRDNNLTESMNLRAYRSKCIFACMYKEDGCSVAQMGHKINEHENICKFRPTKCYVESCNLKISRNGLEHHVKTNHTDRVFGRSAEITTANIGIGPRKVEKYYFSFDQRLYVVSFECELYGEDRYYRIWAKALCPGLVSDRLRVVFVLKNAELKRVLQDSQPTTQEAIFSILEKRPFGGNEFHVNFMKINENQNLVAGCSHYKRNCKLKCPLPECSAIVACRICHDLEIPHHQFNRYAVKIVICCSCGKEQKPSKKCDRCFEQFAQYFCPKCNLYDDESTNLDIFHCDFCRLCRRKESRDVEYYHCGCCDICLPESLRNTHECKYNASKENCNVCNNEMHSSRTPIVPLSCGHYVHKTCRDQESPGDQRCQRCLRSRNLR